MMKKMIQFMGALGASLIVSFAVAGILIPTAVYTSPSGAVIRVAIPNAPVVIPGGSGPGAIAMPPTTAFEINGLAVMSKNRGFDSTRIIAASPTNDYTQYAYPGAGDFRIACGTSHMLFDDPIVYPGQPRKSHLHTFFGNADVSGNDDAVSLGSLSTHGNTTCSGGTGVNRSAYWVPTVIDILTGIPYAPLSNMVYYKNGSDYRVNHITEVTAPVPGLRMIAGKASANGPGQNSRTKWTCLYALGVTVGGQSQSAFTETIPGAACPNGSDVMLLVAFMDCWEGPMGPGGVGRLDSPNHADHMAYSDFYTGCPSTHPVMIPEISFNIHWRVDAKHRPENWRLSSDMYATSILGGYSAHGDWINGWKASVIQGIVDNCLRARRDCHANLDGMHNQFF